MFIWYIFEQNLDNRLKIKYWSHRSYCSYNLRHTDEANNQQVELASMEFRYVSVCTVSCEIYKLSDHIHIIFATIGESFYTRQLAKMCNNHHNFDFNHSSTIWLYESIDLKFDMFLKKVYFEESIWNETSILDPCSTVQCSNYLNSDSQLS